MEPSIAVCGARGGMISPTRNAHPSPNNAKQPSLNYRPAMVGSAHPEIANCESAAEENFVHGDDPWIELPVRFKPNARLLEEVTCLRSAPGIARFHRALYTISLFREACILPPSMLDARFSSVAERAARVATLHRGDCFCHPHINSKR